MLLSFLYQTRVLKGPAQSVSDLYPQESNVSDLVQVQVLKSTTIYSVLLTIHHHLEKAWSTVRIVDSFSPFITIQSDLLCQKLQNTEVKA